MHSYCLDTSMYNISPTLTFIAEILKLGAVIILVQYLDGELTDADERLLRPISGRYCNRVLSLPLPVEAPGCHDHPCKRRTTVSSFPEPTANVHTRIHKFIHPCPQQFTTRSEANPSRKQVNNYKCILTKFSIPFKCWDFVIKSLDEEDGRRALLKKND